MNEYEGVEDTLFIPLTARINISRKFPEYFYDEQSLNLESIIPNNSIEKKSTEYAMMASVARYYNLDKMAQSFIDNHDNCNIINLGVGLETSYFRINRKNSIFWEVDLSNVIELRKKYLEVQENENYVAGDLFKLDWIEDIDREIPSLLIVSGVFQYYHENEIMNFIKSVKKIFKNAELIFDATNKNGVKLANFYVKRTGNKKALMHFYINDAEEFARKTNTKLIEERVFFKDALKTLSKKLGLFTKISMKIADRQKNAILVHLKLS